MLHNLLGKITGQQQDGESNIGKINGTVVLMKKNVLDFNDFNASVLDRVHELVGQRVSLQLISAVHGDPDNGLKGKLGKQAYLEDWITTIAPLTAGESAFKVTFDWEEEVDEFFLKTVTLDNVPDEGRVHFVCNSWVYPAEKYTKDRVFFANKTYLPSEVPLPLRKYIEEELVELRGDGKRKLEEWDRVYYYAYYNDLGDPDKGSEYVRPIMGGSTYDAFLFTFDPNTESRLPIVSSLSIYVPRDERFGHLKMSDFLAYALKSIAQFIRPEIEALFDKTPNEFDSFEDVYSRKSETTYIPTEMLKEIFRTDGALFLRFPMPEVIKEDKTAWRTDEEFAREMLAGVNPVNIPSTITEQRIRNNLDGLTVDEALKNKKLFILDHHDALMPYLRRINSTSNKIYGSRTLLFLKSDGTLKILVIELSLPHPDGDQYGCISNVYTPAEQGVESSIWQLAKAYVAVNDSGNHQLISHWLNTHAVIEPVIIAANRQLSVVHPIYKLLQPHFRDTMYINAIGRGILLNARGVIESTVFPARYALGLSSAVYKDWVFPEQALPADLIKRGVAVKDENSPHGLRLLIEDYPYAVDGIAIWFAIKTWVEDYCAFYYKTNDIIQTDVELQSWWKELVEEGHGDIKDEPWWPKMQTFEELVETCTILIWTASALHAALNFGQFSYAGYLPNRPTISRKFMPEKGTPEYEELEASPDTVFLKTITAQLQTVLGIATIEILSRHSTDEVYLGQRDTPDWTSDIAALEAFEKFGNKLAEIEDQITSMNNDDKLKNRVGSVKIPYTLLFPTSEGGITGKGIPNSVSI
ncbi:linoleate 9S-lipoxygenase 5 [Pyrus ussuriensis x Pyrus communis]|uniref:Lipoxygenase n=1 Tax=Pyrus ussuriensis x Pyrus communis TaxID=2448454 RepID=A0A5N5GVZ0_9ROSA|nr:linoleate 9S-lipoxygenase 5 [Pyrus ussuriensis x Pyrus communis]